MDGDPIVERHDPVADQLLYSVPQAAKILGISPRMAWTFVNRGVLRPRRVGARVLIHRSQLEQFALRDHATKSDNER